ncbi:L,D-transpeptidase family protein [Terrarubrum flagellatum]|uniref:L,D-transpeptidase family protein n=1 Tax=Terrirubrum flagellatum TaxID=2895980 RepID=UPI00314502BF
MKRISRSLFASLAVWPLAFSAFAQEATAPSAATPEPRPLPAFPELQPPDLPRVVVTIDPPSVSAQAAPDVAIAPPDLPPVVVSVEPPLETQAAKIDIPPPDLPDVRVIVEAPKPAETQRPIASAEPPASTGAVALALREKIEKDGPPAHPRLSRALRDEIAAVYGARAHAPFWVDEKGLTNSGRQLLAQLKRADEDGLDSSAYAVAGADAKAIDAASLASLDLNLSVAALMYARDARGGRMDARRISDLIDPSLDLPSAASALQTLAAASDAGVALQAFNPPHPGYRALREKLRELRAASAPVASISIPQGPVLRVGMNDARVALVRERLKLEPSNDATYDAAVAEAVTGFQRERGLPANGTLTRQTVAALSSPNIPKTEADLIANMERWRWLPRDLGERRIVVNIPEFQVRVFDGDKITHQARVIVGKPDTPTPVFSNVMQFLVFNPSWYVPPSILKKEFLPKLATDPTYAERRGYQVIRRGNQITVRQPPGERNALGNIKFMFPNRHAVYLHDTPTRNLFSADRRAFSHGCVRVDQPLQLAEIVLGADRGWTQSRIRSLIGRGEQTVKLEQTIPVHLTYFTMFVDDLGRLETRPDLYGHDRRVRVALGLDG